MDPINQPGTCLSQADTVIDCRGAFELTVSKSGVTAAYRCAAHAEDYYRRMDQLEADLQSRYPGYDNPASPAPAWFDPAYAGESWDEEW